jgi:hypothetical protein
MTSVLARIACIPVWPDFLFVPGVRLTIRLSRIELVKSALLLRLSSTGHKPLFFTDRCGRRLHLIHVVARATSEHISARLYANYASVQRKLDFNFH